MTAALLVAAVVCLVIDAAATIVNTHWSALNRRRSDALDAEEARLQECAGRLYRKEAAMAAEARTIGAQVRSAHAEHVASVLKDRP